MLFWWSLKYNVARAGLLCMQLTSARQTQVNLRIRGVRSTMVCLINAVRCYTQKADLGSIKYDHVRECVMGLDGFTPQHHDVSSVFMWLVNCFSKKS
jgi:hypothetical protein